jgi:multidrug efflux pump subunit AcrA (membrane-fusion protein)
MMDLSNIAGLTDEQKVAITAANTAAIEAATVGLVNKNNELIGEKKTALQTVTDNESLLSEARAASVKLAEEKLLAEGKYDEALALREKQNAELTASTAIALKEAQDALKSRDFGAAENDIMNMFHSDHKDAGKALLSLGLEMVYNEAGQPVPTFKSGGEVVATGVGEIKSWASDNTTFKRYLTGVDSGGAGTTASIGAVSVTPDSLEACKGDKALETAYFNNQLTQ